MFNSGPLFSKNLNSQAGIVINQGGQDAGKTVAKQLAGSTDAYKALLQPRTAHPDGAPANTVFAMMVKCVFDVVQVLNMICGGPRMGEVPLAHR